VSAVSNISAYLGQTPNTLRDELLVAYNQILRNYREHRWEPSELNGGKLCEIIYSIIRGFVDGKFPAKAKKPRNMVDACRDFEKADSTKFTRSVRIQIPRMLLALYEIRNNRGVGHIGGDVSPNQMDATVVVGTSKWLMAELIRLFHDVDTKTASQVVDALTERSIPLIWEIDGKLRVLRPSMSMRDKTLAILYQVAGSVAESDLVNWVEHSNPSAYRRDVLRKAHKAKLIEYDATARTARI